MANVVVCPDKNNEYSNLIVHLKYFDSVASNRPLVCAGFDSVKEINVIGNFARLYKPSDLDDMENQIRYCLENNSMLLDSSRYNRQIMAETLTYRNFKDQILSISLKRTVV
ncbi:glycosyltransferase [Parahaliea sp. F7430]|uniref:Glycosyltransferase n=1 Tax=Sediminihaliea albiluteola TaxID=2758564 RepID=A0A7W2TUR9_9GAMM|nr:glycosyltransferase [Sediminihaliea albiluteola]